jgi:hypothetical protein
MNNAFVLKAILLIQTAVLLVYTGLTIQREGANFISAFISNVLQVGWSGQFNLDFACYLVLSGLWVMWRNQFNSKGIVLGLAAMILGIVVFAPYVLYLLFETKGDLKRVLVGSGE